MSSRIGAGDIVPQRGATVPLDSSIQRADEAMYRMKETRSHAIGSDGDGPAKSQ
jgi:hypothetical protein